jgi:hypothetical protein
MKNKKLSFFSKIHSSETLAKISGENNQFYGKTHLSEALVRMSKVKPG